MPNEVTEFHQNSSYCDECGDFIGFGFDRGALCVICGQQLCTSCTIIIKFALEPVELTGSPFQDKLYPLVARCVCRKHVEVLIEALTEEGHKAS